MNMNRHTTLGKLIAIAEEYPADRKLCFYIDFHSYRGYYEDLGIEISGSSCGDGITCGELVEKLKATNGRAFSGWKDDDCSRYMDNDSLVWLSEVGYSGIPMTEAIFRGFIESARERRGEGFAGLTT